MNQAICFQVYAGPSRLLLLLVLAVPGRVYVVDTAEQEQGEEVEEMEQLLAERVLSAIEATQVDTGCKSRCKNVHRI